MSEPAVITTNDNEPKSKRSKNKAPYIIIATLVCLFIGFAVVKQGAKPRQVTCSGKDSIVSGYIKVTNSPRNIADSGPLLKEIEAVPSFSSDVVCSYMLVSLYVREGNRAKAVEAYKKYPEATKMKASSNLQLTDTEVKDMLVLLEAWSKESPLAGEAQG